MKTKLFISLLFVSFYMSAQDAGVFERLHSPTIEKPIYLTFDGEKFTYKEGLNALDNYTIEKNTTQQFQIFNEKSNNFKIYLKFYNPLTTKVESSSKEIEDAYYTAISNFISKLPTEYSSFNISAPTSPSALATKGLGDKNILKLVDRTLNSLPYNSPNLYEWFYMLKRNMTHSRFTDVWIYNSFSEKLEIVSNISNVEDFLFQGVKIKVTDDRRQGYKKKINEWVKYCNDTLKNSKLDINTFKARLKVAKKVKEDLDKNYNKNKAYYDQIIVALKDEMIFFESFLDPKSAVVTDTEFRNLSQAKSLDLEVNLADKFSEYEKSIKSLNDLIESLDKFVEEFEKDQYGYKVIADENFPWKSEKGKLYSLTGSKLSDNGEILSDTKNSIELEVYKSQGRMAVFLSAGVFYTPFEYKNYGISEGVIVETQGDPVYVRPAAYLNFLFKPKRGDILYPLLQIGITQGVDTPLFPLGVGFNIRDKFSITGGALLAFQNELDNLKIGALADDAALKDDITSKVRFGWYLSINYKLGK